MITMGVSNIYLADEALSSTTLSLPEVFEDDLYVENDDAMSFSDFINSSTTSYYPSFIKWINDDIERELMLKMELAMEKERV